MTPINFDYFFRNIYNYNNYNNLNRKELLLELQLVLQFSEMKIHIHGSNSCLLNFNCLK